MIKKILFLFLCMNIVVCGFVFSENLPSQQELVSRAHERGITKYDTIDDFHFDDVVSREQAASMIFQYLYITDLRRDEPASSEGDFCSDFTDKLQFDESLKDNIVLACKWGLFKGYNNMFMPRALLVDTDIKTIMQRAHSFNALIDLNDLHTLLTENYVPYTRGQLITLFYVIYLRYEVQVNSLKDSELEPIQAELNQAKVTWEENKINAYSITLERRCFCEESMIPKTYLIDNGQLSGSVLTMSGDVYTGEAEFFSVEGMFDIIQEAITKRNWTIDIVYDDLLGYPKQIYINEFKLIQDDEVTYIIALTESK